MLAGNVDNSAIINSIDALAVQKRFTGMISSFPAGNWIFENPSVNITGNSAQTMNIKGLCYGDVNGSFTPVYP